MILVWLAIVMFFVMLSACVSALPLDPIREGIGEVEGLRKGVLPKKTQMHLAPPIE